MRQHWITFIRSCQVRDQAERQWVGVEANLSRTRLTCLALLFFLTWRPPLQIASRRYEEERKVLDRMQLSEFWSAIITKSLNVQFFLNKTGQVAHFPVWITQESHACQWINLYPSLSSFHLLALATLTLHWWAINHDHSIHLPPLILCNNISAAH